MYSLLAKRKLGANQVADDNTGVNTADSIQQQSSSPEPAAPTNEQNVPKWRLDEVLQRERNAQQQLEIAQHLLRQTAQQARPAAQPRELPEHLKRLKEENPGVFQEVMAMKQQVKQSNATQFQMAEEMDRQKFINRFGESGIQKLEAVEAQLDQLRQAGHMNYDRGIIYVNMLGMEAVENQRKPRVASQLPPAQVPNNNPPPPAQDYSAPSVDPRAAVTSQRGVASNVSSDDRIADLERMLDGKPI